MLPLLLLPLPLLLLPRLLHMVTAAAVINAAWV